MMIITSSSYIDVIANLFTRSNIQFSIGEANQRGKITIVDFMNVKGLEKEVVFIAGIEDLYDKTKNEMLFEDEENKIRKEQLSRRIIYVAITRPLEQLVIYYTQPENRFIQELLKLNTKIAQKRLG